MLPGGVSTETPPLLLPPTVGQALWLSPLLYPNLERRKELGAVNKYLERGGKEEGLKGRKQKGKEGN